MKLPNKVFDTLKWCVLVFIPALTTLYVSLSVIWGFPYASEIAKTSAAVIFTFLLISRLIRSVISGMLVEIINIYVTTIIIAIAIGIASIKNGFKNPMRRTPHITKFIIYQGISTSFTIITHLEGLSFPFTIETIENIILIKQIGDNTAKRIKNVINK